jgi:hypothetical protein
MTSVDSKRLNEVVESLIPCHTMRKCELQELAPLLEARPRSDKRLLINSETGSQYMAILRQHCERENYIFLVLGGFSGMHPPPSGYNVLASSFGSVS